MAITSGRVGVNKSQVDNVGMLKVATVEVIGGVAPVDKTSGMTQDVGIDTDGKLYTYPNTEYTLPIATDSILGGVKIGDGIDVDQTGIIEVDAGDGLAIGQSGSVEVNVGEGLEIDSNGAVAVEDGKYLTVPETEDEILVGVSDSGIQENVTVGTGLTLSNGVLSASGGGGDGLKLVKLKMRGAVGYGYGEYLMTDNNSTISLTRASDDTSYDISNTKLIYIEFYIVSSGTSGTHPTPSNVSFSRYDKGFCGFVSLDDVGSHMYRGPIYIYTPNANTVYIEPFNFSKTNNPYEIKLSYGYSIGGSETSSIRIFNGGIVDNSTISGTVHVYINALYAVE